MTPYSHFICQFVLCSVSWILPCFYFVSRNAGAFTPEFAVCWTLMYIVVRIMSASLMQRKSPVSGMLMSPGFQKAANDVPQHIYGPKIPVMQCVTSMSLAAQGMNTAGETGVIWTKWLHCNGSRTTLPTLEGTQALWPSLECQQEVWVSLFL